MTVQQIVSEVQTAFGNAPAPMVLSAINRAHRDLCNEYPVLTDSLTINLTAGTGEYAIDRDVTSVRSVAYKASSGDTKALAPTDVGDEDAENANWRYRSNGRPRAFYIDGGKIGLIPKPDATTSGGYPSLEVWITEASTLALSDSLPTSIPTISPYVSGACFYYAHASGDQEKVRFYKNLFEMDRADLERTLGHRNRHHRTRATPAGGYVVAPI